jgi:hypothetical protein
VPLSRSEFLASLIEAVPETQPVVEEHLVDMDSELQLHLLMADLRRLAIATFEQGDVELLNLGTFYPR